MHLLNAQKHLYKQPFGVDLGDSSYPETDNSVDFSISHDDLG